MAGIFEDMPNPTVQGYLKGAANPYQDAQAYRLGMANNAAKWGEYLQHKDVLDNPGARNYIAQMANASANAAGADIGRNGAVVGYNPISNPTYNPEYLASQEQAQMEREMQTNPDYANQRYIKTLGDNSYNPADMNAVNEYQQLLTTGSDMARLQQLRNQFMTQRVQGQGLWKRIAPDQQAANDQRGGNPGQYDFPK
jgi:hypothetical protein